LATEFQQLGDGCLLALCKCWAHIAIMAHFINDVELFMRIYIAPDNYYIRPCKTGCSFLSCQAPSAIRRYRDGWPKELQEDYTPVTFPRTTLPMLKDTGPQVVL